MPTLEYAMTNQAHKSARSATSILNHEGIHHMLSLLIQMGIFTLIRAGVCSCECDKRPSVSPLREKEDGSLGVAGNWPSKFW